MGRVRGGRRGCKGRSRGGVVDVDGGDGYRRRGRVLSGVGREGEEPGRRGGTVEPWRPRTREGLEGVMVVGSIGTFRLGGRMALSSGLDEWAILSHLRERLDRRVPSCSFKVIGEGSLALPPENLHLPNNVRVSRPVRRPNVHVQVLGSNGGDLSEDHRRPEEQGRVEVWRKDSSVHDERRTNDEEGGTTRKEERRGRRNEKEGGIRRNDEGRKEKEDERTNR
jgi:hypothetical protein